MRRTLFAAALALATTGPAPHPGPPQALERALAGITADDLAAHVEFLSDDLLEGRAPGTRGSRLAQLYIETQFARAGLRAVVAGGFRQDVPLVGRTLDPRRTSLRFDVGDRTVAAEYPGEAVFWSGRADTGVELQGELVFAGYGVNAPEYRWDDFTDVDVEGKILLVLINDPPAPPHDPDRFGGGARSHYGRWTYKFEEARRQGAAGALIIHTAQGAGYPWSVVRNSWTGERLSLPRGSDEPDPLPLEGWIRGDFTREVLGRAGLNLDELYVQAARRDFRPIETGITLHAEVATAVRRFETSNLLGLLRGSDPDRRDEAVVYTAHYDHLGNGRGAADGDSIYNGAYDNASGVAVLLELAEAFAQAETRPARSVLFIATAAEEGGMLGAERYVRDPAVPLGRTAVVINIDGANLWGETDDVVAPGAAQSSLEPVVRERARQLGMRLAGERAAERGLCFRSDQFPFARAGVPAIQIQHGIDFRGRPDGWGRELLAGHHAERYHQPDDELDPLDADLSGAVQQARLALLVGYDVAAADSMPRWDAAAGYGPRPRVTSR